MFVWLSFALAAAALADPCGSEATNVGLLAAAADVSDAFAELDVPRFEAARDRAAALLPCLAEPLTPAAAAAVHRVGAIDAFVVGDEPGAVSAFRSAVAAYPAWRLPSDTVPRGHPLRLAFDAAVTAAPGPTSTLPVPLDATLLVDGRAALDLPLDRPVILQWIDGLGAVAWTRRLASGEPPPAYAAAPEDARAAYLARSVITLAPRRRPVALALTSGGLAVGAAALYGGALASGAAFRDPSTPYDDLGAIRTRTHGLLIGAATSLAGALASGSVAIARW